MNVTLNVNSIFEDVIKLRSCAIRVGPNPMTGVLIRGQETKRQTHMENIMKQRTGVVCPQTVE